MTHYFKIDKAKKELGYSPKHHDMLGVVHHFRKLGYGYRRWRSSSYTLSQFLVDLALAAIVIVVLFSFLPVVTARYIVKMLLS